MYAETLVTLPPLPPLLQPEMEEESLPTTHLHLHMVPTTTTTITAATITTITLVHMEMEDVVRREAVNLRNVAADNPHPIVETVETMVRSNLPSVVC